MRLMLKRLLWVFCKWVHAASTLISALVVSRVQQWRRRRTEVRTSGTTLRPCTRPWARPRSDSSPRTMTTSTRPSTTSLWNLVYCSERLLFINEGVTQWWIQDFGRGGGPVEFLTPRRFLGGKGGPAPRAPWIRYCDRTSLVNNQLQDLLLFGLAYICLYHICQAQNGSSRAHDRWQHRKIGKTKIGNSFFSIKDMHC